MTWNKRQRGRVGVPLVHFRSAGANVNLGQVMAWEDKSQSQDKHPHSFKPSHWLQYSNPMLFATPVWYVRQDNLDHVQAFTSHIDHTGGTLLDAKEQLALEAH